MAIKVAIIGGGVAGVTAALTLGNLGFEVDIFEKNRALISGPPFCHLHAGGNLYREISDQQCITLLRQSIDFVKLYPFSIDKRPTIFATPIYDPFEPLDMIDRLELLTNEYKKLIDKDASNKVLGEANNYYEIFSKDKLLEISKRDIVEQPKSNDEWLIPFAKNLDFDTIKFPVIVVQEYGINMFRVAANSGLALENMNNVNIHRETNVVSVKEIDNGFELSYNGTKNGSIKVDYLINAAGFRTGLIDDMLGIKEKRLVEFKAAYTTKWDIREKKWPEVIFHGIRGTKNGMRQFTPYCNGYVQLHVMTPDVTLFSDGLVESSNSSSYPRLSKKYIDIIENGWDDKLRDERTLKARDYIAYFFPKFKSAKVGGKPLFGAQQIIGSDPTLRVAEVSFPKPKYARCEIVKVSSVNDMSKVIVNDIAKYFNIDINKDIFDIKELQILNDDDITKRACSVAEKLGYPNDLGIRCNIFDKD